ncbi:helix-turn-helix domain-containing protein [Methylomonas koyamae]|uniref:helix-turn-helix domain-containing protein n=1 Tax=Methylomonas koyamae TaxID=702114 RepID=UPI001642B9E3|nr:helix-turn-helix transcriptional regulator [Methylomonas koyamae]
MSNFGDRLKEERERLQLSQSAFGDIGGVRKQAQLHYEKGERFPDSNYLAAIANSGVDVAYVLTGQRTQNAAVTPMEVALLDNYRHSARDVQLGVSKLLAETGRAVDRANSLAQYPELPISGLGLGTHSSAVHSEGFAGEGNGI